MIDYNKFFPIDDQFVFIKMSYLVFSIFSYFALTSLGQIMNSRRVLGLSR